MKIIIIILLLATAIISGIGSLSQEKGYNEFDGYYITFLATLMAIAIITLL